MKSKLIVLLAFLFAIGVIASACGGGATPTPAATPVAITAAVITAKGEVVPEDHTKVAFTIGGTVSQIPVKEGQQVKKGNTLALLDTSDLQLELKTAQDALTVAQASLTQAKTPASAEEIAAAEASVASAQGAVASAQAGLDRAKKPPTAQDIAAATSALASAQSAYSSAVTAYNRAKNGPTADELQVLQSTLAKAKAALDVAQAAYDRIGGASNPFSAQTPQALQLQQATQDYQIAISNYNQSTKPDASTVAQASAAIAQAKAQVDQAQVTLQKLKDSPNQQDIDQAQAGLDSANAQLDSAKAQLDLKKKGARPEDIAVAQARVDQAQTGIDQAKAALAKATLVSPIDGTITDIALQEGELAAAGQPIFTIADLTNLKVETTDLDEFGAAKVKVGQAATIRVNAFTDKTLTGKVTEIADQSVLLASGDVSYPVTIVLDSQDPALRWGMTVKVEFAQ